MDCLPPTERGKRFRSSSPTNRNVVDSDSNRMVTTSSIKSNGKLFRTKLLMMMRQRKNVENADESKHSAEFTKLPDDVICNICSFLDVKSLLKVQTLNRALNIIAKTNSAGWENLCQQLWKDKIHISNQAKGILPRDAQQAYKLSISDAKQRDYVTREELCYDPETNQGTIWSIRFKQSAGPDWTSWDPWFNYQPCRKMVFLQDGRVKMYIPKTKQENQEDEDDGQQPRRTHSNESQQEQLISNAQQPQIDGMELSDPVFRSGPRLTNHNPHIVEGNLQNPPSPMTWRFVAQPMDFPNRPIGSYIRFSVGNREVPTYVCRRSPTNNWGFVMESCWGVFASFELPPRPRETSNAASQLRRGRIRRRLRRAHNMDGNEIYVQIEVEESSDDDDDDDDNGLGQSNSIGNGENNNGGYIAPLLPGLDRNELNRAQNRRMLIHDDSFDITINVQWREAFLYNIGTETLPEGEDALTEFSRIYDTAFTENQDT